MRQTFSANLVGNKNKIAKLDSLYEQVQKLSLFMFNNIDWNDKNNNKFSKELYSNLRENFPDINSKLIQKAMKEYGKFGKAKIAKSPIEIPLIFDNQNFDLKFRNGYYDLFVKFLKLRFPIEGLRTIQKIKKKEIKQISIKKIDDVYRIYFVCEVHTPELHKQGKILGLDLNVKSQVLSDGKFFHTKEFAHRKDEYRKNKGKKNIENFTKDYIHKITNAIVLHLIAQGVKVLRLEQLKHIRKKSRKSYGKENKNYKVNNCFPYNMMRLQLIYKCLMNGIDIEFVNPAHTSDTCYKCNSSNTLRKPREILICLNSECLNKIHSDLNGARNIVVGKPITMGQRMTRPSCTIKDATQPIGQVASIA